MPRKPKTSYQQYGEPTEMIAVRIPASLHRRILAGASKGDMPKSRKIVELLELGLNKKIPPAPKTWASTGNIFD